MREHIFDISGLQCAYDNRGVVLEIEKLTIPHGKLIVLVGKSGSGKSTFLETLGLMNNTIRSGKIMFYPVDEQTDAIDIGKLWHASNTMKMSVIRNKHMSFIFQNTNLMPNFSALENICLTAMIQGTDYATAREQALMHLQRLGLEGLNDGRLSVQLSGGQKQRVAFVRAINTNYDVLFGDEPTGNLDEFNSHDLMELLKNIIRSGRKTAVIVSHNIDIALRYADQVVVIQKSNNHRCGLISPLHVISRQTDDNCKDWWVQFDGSRVDDPKQFIMQAMNA